MMSLPTIGSPPLSLTGMGKRLRGIFATPIHNDVDVIVQLSTLGPDGITARPLTIALYDTGNGLGMNSDSIEAHNFAVAGRLMRKRSSTPLRSPSMARARSLPFIGSPSNCPSLPAGSVVGHTPYQTQVYWEPGKVSPGILLNPGNYWVIGNNESAK